MSRLTFNIQSVPALTTRKITKYQDSFDSSQGRRVALIEPISAMFTENATFTVTDNNAKSVLDYLIHTSGTWEPTEVGKITFRHLKNLGLLDLANRGGAAYHQWPTKRYANYVKARRYIPAALEIWGREWQLYARDRLVEMIKDYGQKCLSNYYYLQANPEDIVGDKSPNTGTGWLGKISTRGDAAKHFNEVDIIDEIMMYIDDTIQAISVWPEEGSIIMLPTKFKGIRAGVRMDLDDSKLQEKTFQCSARAREVGSTPPGILFNPKVNGKDFQKDMWSKYMSRYHLVPFDTRSYLKALTTPPITADFIDETDVVLLSVDFGWQDRIGIIDKPPVQFPSPNYKFGADQIVLHGIVDRNVYGDDFFQLVSGAPWTMMQYLVTVGHMIANYITEQALEAEIFQVGDDVHIIGRFEDCKQIYNKFGHWLRTKGMEKNSVYILGQQVIWHDRDRLDVMMLPRALKTTTSPIAAEKLGVRQVNIGDTVHMKANKELQRQASIMWKMYPDIVLYRGTPDEYVNQMSSVYREARTRMADLGYSDWIKYMFMDTTDGMDSDDI